MKEERTQLQDRWGRLDPRDLQENLELTVFPEYRVKEAVPARMPSIAPALQGKETSQGMPFPEDQASIPLARRLSLDQALLKKKSLPVLKEEKKFMPRRLIYFYRKIRNVQGSAASGSSAPDSPGAYSAEGGNIYKEVTRNPVWLRNSLSANQQGHLCQAASSQIGCHLNIQ